MHILFFFSGLWSRDRQGHNKTESSTTRPNHNHHHDHHNNSQTHSSQTQAQNSTYETTFSHLAAIATADVNGQASVSSESKGTGGHRNSMEESNTVTSSSTTIPSFTAPLSTTTTSEAAAATTTTTSSSSTITSSLPPSLDDRGTEKDVMNPLPPQSQSQPQPQPQLHDEKGDSSDERLLISGLDRVTRINDPSSNNNDHNGTGASSTISPSSSSSSSSSSLSPPTAAILKPSGHTNNISGSRNTGINSDSSGGGSAREPYTLSVSIMPRTHLSLLLTNIYPLIYMTQTHPRYEYTARVINSSIHPMPPSPHCPFPSPPSSTNIFIIPSIQSFLSHYTGLNRE